MLGTRRALWDCLAAGLIAIVAGCSSSTSVRDDGNAGGSAGTGGSGAQASGGSGGAGASAGGGGTGASGGSGGVASGCPSGRGPAMVRVSGFCIDSTEVTRAQYEAFVVDTSDDTSGQVGACAGNSTFVPAAQYPPATDAFDHPVNHVDWCDAFAFCAWAGKRLCGRIGGGSSSFGGFADSSQSQWYEVCSNGGRNDYPYGSTFDPDACNGFGAPTGCEPPGSCEFVDVGSLTRCQGVGEYAGVFDLSGSVLEWEDSCSVRSDGVEICRQRGGGVYALSEYGMACDEDVAGEKLSTAPGTGFRCCAD